MRAAHVSMRLQRDGLALGLEPKSKVKWDRPLSTAMGMGGSASGDAGRCTANDLTSWTKNLSSLILGGEWVSVTGGGRAAKGTEHAAEGWVGQADSASFVKKD